MSNRRNRSNSHAVSAFLAVAARRRELLAAQKQQPPQAQTPHEPVLVEQPAEQQDPPPRPLAEQAVPPPRPELASPALYGLAGCVIRSLAPHSEADPVALLLQFLAAFGNLAGPAPHSLVGSTPHGLNLFVVLVGESSKARKGTSWRQIASGR